MKSITAYYNTLKLAIELVYRASPPFFALLVLLSIISGLLPLVSIFLYAEIIDLLVQYVTLGNTLPGQIPNDLLIALFWIGVVLIVTQILSRAKFAIELLYQNRVTAYVQLLIAEKAAKLDLAFFEDPAFHNKLYNVSSDSSYRPVVILSQLTQIFTVIFTITSVGVLVITWQPWIIPVLIFSTTLGLITNAYYSRQRYKLTLSKTQIVRRGDYIGSLLTSDLTAKEVRVFGLREYFLEKYKAILDEVYKYDSSLTKREAVHLSLLDILSLSIRPVIIGYIAIQALSNNITIGEFSLYTQAIFQIENGLSILFVSLSQLYENALFLNSLSEFFRLKPDVEETQAGSNREIVSYKTAPTIEFVNVSFQYHNSDEQVLRNVSFIIHPGEAVALVGLNGAGKTTIVKLLLGLYRPTDGKILINGVNLQEMDVHDFRKHMSVIFQDYPLYNFSVYDNVGIGRVNQISESNRVYAAAEKSGLNKVVEELPEGFDTIIGRWFDRGHELSGGQQQLVALARSIMRSAPVLILDEPTAALDIQNERNFFDKLLNDQKTNSQTIIFISHRFASVRHADRIFVIENGYIVESGTHEDLMTLHGKYSEMFNLQAESYIL